jgi:hypothetical protein
MELILTSVDLVLSQDLIKGLRAILSPKKSTAGV